ncbi:MAG: hypothetical protein Q7U08_03710, partial [Flavobacteriaceae bacterium]|nr:hypothetical protein [Flavobacteriaceae bacterium]
MKTTFNFLWVITFFSLALNSCENEEYEIYNMATPVTMTMSELRSSVKILPPQQIVNSGKIYVYEEFIFINDEGKGVHVIDNSVPASPKKISFLKIHGNVDVAVKDEMLFADSFTDLVVFDISNIRNIVQKNRLNNVFPHYFIYPTVDNDFPIYFDYQNMTSDKVIVDWNITQEKRKPQNWDMFIRGEAMLSSTSDGTVVGKGGSLARFMI